MFTETNISASATTWHDTCSPKAANIEPQIKINSFYGSKGVGAENLKPMRLHVLTTN